MKNWPSAALMERSGSGAVVAANRSSRYNLALVGFTTDETCRTVAADTPAVAWASRALMGVALAFPAEMEI